MKQYLLIFLLTSQSLFCQSNQTETYQLQSFAPKSPEAAAFLKYGEYPVNLSTGVPNISIPIYTLNAGDFQLPITLDYHASGIKVSQEATWVGLGWNLNFGAQIIVDVRDDSDEYNVGSTPNANDVRNYMINNPLSYFHQYYQDLFANSKVKDIYNFSSPTANGKFYYDSTTANNQLVIFPPNEFKVENIVGGGFKIIDNYGNNYYFGQTKELCQNLGQNQLAPYRSAWFVDKIETSKKEEINFTYTNGGDVIQENFSELINHNITKQLRSGCNQMVQNHLESISSIQNNVSRTRTISKKISEINYKNTKILFNSSSGRLDFYDNVFDSYSLNNGPKKLDLITIQNKKGELNVYQNIKDYQFVYSYFESGVSNSIAKRSKRLKLVKVVENSLNLEYSNETVFTYSIINLPDKDSKAIDYFGYFNNRLNYSTIPHQTIVFSQHGVSTSYESIGNADRSINPLYVEAGMLKEIKYPTKGKTSFDYESNSFYGRDKFDKFNEHIVNANLLQGIGVSNNNPNELPSPNGYTTVCQTGNNCCIQYLELPFSAIDANAKLSFEVNNSVNGDIARSKYAYARIKVYDQNGQIYDSGKIKSSQQFNIDLFLNGAGIIVLEVYDIIIKIQNPQLRFYNNDSSLKTCLYGGLRIKSITNLDVNNQFVSKKTFDYSKTSDTNKSSGLLINEKNLWFQTNKFSNYTTMPCGSGWLTGNDWLENTTESFKSQSITGNESNAIVYEEVIEKNVDVNNNTNGFTVSRFTSFPDYFQDNQGMMFFDNSHKRGKLLNKEVFKVQSNNAILINKTSNEYIEDSRRVSNYKGFKMFKHNNIQFIPGPPFIIYIPLSLNQIYEPVGYDFFIPWFYQKSSENTDYFYDANNVLSGSNTSTTNYFYDNPNHLQLTRTETINSKNETLKSIIYYPDDLIGQPCMSNLKSLNRIGEVIKTENYIGSNLLSSQIKTYKDWGNNLYLPEYIKSSKGTPEILENRIKINIIDNTNGNNLELKQENGTVVSYIYGYNKSLPIAKIENATNSQVATALGLVLDNVNETNMPQLDNLRTLLPNAMITTFTHIPLVGVNTITDPKGDKITYEYDTFNRLKWVKDKNGNIFSENEYHYKN